MKSEPSAITPAALAQRWGVTVKKVLAFIDAGELIALNLAVNARGEKPRYRIKESDIAAFEEQRRSRPVNPRPTRRRRQAKDETVIEFY